MSDISQLPGTLPSRVGRGKGEWANSPHITTLPGSGRGAGRGGKGGKGRGTGGFWGLGGEGGVWKEGCERKGVKGRLGSERLGRFEGSVRWWALWGSVYRIRNISDWESRIHYFVINSYSPLFMTNHWNICWAKTAFPSLCSSLVGSGFLALNDGSEYPHPHKKLPFPYYCSEGSGSWERVGWDGEVKILRYQSLVVGLLNLALSWAPEYFQTTFRYCAIF